MSIEIRTAAPSADLSITSGDWVRLLCLSVLWGGSFFFAGVAVKELPPLTIVFVRVGLAALLLLPLIRIYRIPVPTTLAGWRPFIVMALLNNVLPFSLLVSGQTTTVSTAVLSSSRLTITAGCVFLSSLPRAGSSSTQ